MSIKERLLKLIDKATPSYALGMSATTVVGFVLLIWGCFLPGEGEWVLTGILSLTAYVLGVPLGMLVSPHPKEEGNFRAFTSYLATFISGYVVSRLTGVNFGKIAADSLATPLRSGRVLLFVSFFILGVVQTYFLRVYLDADRALGGVTKNPTGSS